MTSAKKRVGIVLAVVMTGTTVLVAVASGGEKNMFCDIIDGDLDAVRERVAKGETLGCEDPNSPGYIRYGVTWTCMNTGFGMSPLHVAAYSGRARIADFLLSKGADINAHTSRTASGEPGPTPLHVAALQGHTNVVDTLLRHGADLETETDLGLTPLMFVLSSHIPVKEDSEERKAGRITAYPGKEAVVQYLLSKGAKATVFTAICMTNGIPLLKELLKQTPNAVHARNTSDATPLHVAARVLNTEAAKLLIATGADINAKDKQGETPLLTALFFSWWSLEGLQAPDTNNANANLTVNPLRDFVELLTKNGADTETQWCCQYGCHRGTPLMLALAGVTPYRDERMTVIRSGLKRRDACPARIPALIETAELLIRNGANIAPQASIASGDSTPPGDDNSIVPTAGWTPLHYAACFGRTNMVDMLLTKGAKTDIKNEQGLTPLALARSQNKGATVEQVYKSHGVTIDAVAEDAPQPAPKESKWKKAQ